MRKILFATTFLLVLALALPTQSEGQNKGKNKGGPGGGELSPAVTQAVAAALNSAEITGVVTAVDADSSTATVRLDIPVWDRNPNFKGGAGGGNNAIQQIQRLMRPQGGRGRGGAQNNPVRILQQIAKGGAKGGEGGNTPFKMTTHSKELKVEANKAVIKRGKETAKFEDLMPGMTVKVYPAAAKTAKDPNKKADDLDLEGGAAIKFKARQIVILEGVAPAPVENPVAANADKKKKK